MEKLENMTLIPKYRHVNIKYTNNFLQEGAVALLLTTSLPLTETRGALANISWGQMLPLLLVFRRP